MTRKKTVLDEVEDIRQSNNSLWMNVLRIALEAAPIKTKQLIKEISDNDEQVTKKLRSLT